MLIERSTKLHFCILMVMMMRMASSTLSQTPPPLLVTNLIHHNSIHSPFNDPNKISKELKYSRKGATSSLVLQPTKLESELVPANRQEGFLARLEIGELRVEQFVYVDTGSNMLWVNCEPCRLNVPEPIYNPAKSTTYQMENCTTSQLCGTIGPVRSMCRSDNNKCEFQVSYADNDMVTGHIAKETFRFGRSNEMVRDIVFGCARTTSLYVNGVMGLGMNRVSFLSQRQASKFSYCLGNISDRSYAYNTLAIGDQLELMGEQTPLILQGQYFITLESISFGDKTLDIDPQVFRRNLDDYTGGMALDTGSTFSYLPEAVLEKLEKEITNFIDNVVLVPNYSDYRICYSGVLTRDLTSFPEVRFKFQEVDGDEDEDEMDSDTNTMELTAENLFLQIDEQHFCLGIRTSESHAFPFSLMGNLMQQFYYMVFDLKQMKLSFEKMDCASLGDHIGYQI